MFGMVYIATNKRNGKKYVGATIQSLESRKRQHLSEARGHILNDNRWRNAIIRFGCNGFDWKPLDYADSKEMLRTKERKWIILLRTNERKFGYNIRPAFHMEE